MTTKQLTLTHYECTTARGETFRGDSDPTQSYFWKPGEVTVVKVETTYLLGDHIEVDAFGRWRPGIVTKLGRTRVEVDYQRSQSGNRGKRSFSPREIRLSNHTGRIVRTTIQEA